MGIIKQTAEWVLGGLSRLIPVKPSVVFRNKNTKRTQAVRFFCLFVFFKGLKMQMCPVLALNVRSSCPSTTFKSKLLGYTDFFPGFLGLPRTY